jgi:hypothetical protein
MKMPRPTGLRLVTRAVDPREPDAPLGLKGFVADGEGVAVLLDPSGLDDIGAVAEQIPHADTLPRGTTAVVLETAARTGSTWQRLFARPVRATRRVRCTALLLRGYVAIGAGKDPDSETDLAWGTVP